MHTKSHLEMEKKVLSIRKDYICNEDNNEDCPPLTPSSRHRSRSPSRTWSHTSTIGWIWIPSC